MYLLEVDLISLLAVFFASLMAAMGLGGGTVLLLYLSLATALSQQQAQAINLLLFIPAAALSLIIHHKNGFVSKEYLKPCLAGGIIGGIVGSLLGNRIDGSMLNQIFGIFLLLVGIREFFLAVRSLIDSRKLP